MFPRALSSQTPNLAIGQSAGSGVAAQLSAAGLSGYRPLREG